MGAFFRNRRPGLIGRPSLKGPPQGRKVGRSITRPEGKEMRGETRVDVVRGWLLRPPLVSVFALFGVPALLLVLPSPALANNDAYACQLTSVGVVKRFTGLPHAIEEKNLNGGTDEKLGAFTSSCAVIVYKEPPRAGQHPFGISPKFRVRKGFAKIEVLATVQDEGEGGDNWEPDQIAIEQHAEHKALVQTYGGREINFPVFGQSEDFGAEWGASEDNAVGTWRDGADGFISVQASTHGGPAGQVLVNVAGKIVPGFKP